MADITDFTALDLIDYFGFLDEFRESGARNMFGATVPLTRQFPVLGVAEARVVLKAWMDTFDGDTSAEDRAYTALGVEA